MSTNDDDIRTVLADAWREFLDVDQVSDDDNFLDIGGNSLAAMRVANRLRDKCGVEVTLSDVLGDQTFAVLVAIVEQSRRRRSESSERGAATTFQSPDSPAR